MSDADRKVERAIGLISAIVALVQLLASVLGKKIGKDGQDKLP